jgi:heme exporter protein D
MKADASGTVLFIVWTSDTASVIWLNKIVICCKQKHNFHLLQTIKKEKERERENKNRNQIAHINIL